MTRVLIVDDDDSVRRATVRGFKIAGGFTITEATNGREALDLFQTGKFDLIVSDLNMPQMEGNELCREVRKTSKVPFILMSGNASVFRLGHEAGADRCFLKPASMSDIRDALDALIPSRSRPSTGHEKPR